MSLGLYIAMYTKSFRIKNFIYVIVKERKQENYIRAEEHLLSGT